MAWTSGDGGTHLDTPTLELVIGRGVFRQDDLGDKRSAPEDRAEASFGSLSRRGKQLHLVFQNFQAGEPWSPLVLSLEVEGAGTSRLGTTV